MSKEVTVSLICVAVGVFLALISTIGYDSWKEFKEEEKQNVVLCRKLVEEIRYNVSKAQMIELSGEFTPFTINEWLNFTGSPAFYKLSDDTKRTLNSFYRILRFRNDGIFKDKALEGESQYMLKTEYLARLTTPFLEHLVRNKIIDLSDATAQWIIPEEIKSQYEAIPREGLK
ncbi:hypothetical protein KKA24_03620 [Patescibacteria group bacterium]|nr:hypothetical protein [Patescibacteria group bacterium]